MSESNIQLAEYFLMPGYIFLTRTPHLISTVLGSCVAVSFWDSRNQCGGMANYLYPRFSESEKATSQYGNAALEHMIRMFQQEGSRNKDMYAQIFGGASDSSAACMKVARENIAVARSVLNKTGFEPYPRTWAVPWAQDRLQYLEKRGDRVQGQHPSQGRLVSLCSRWTLAQCKCRVRISMERIRSETDQGPDC